MDQALRGLTEEGNSRVLLMSATQPALLSEARELAGDAAQVAGIFAAFRRYRLIFRHRCPQSLETFIDGLLPRLLDERRVMITLNTRQSAKAIWKAVKEAMPGVPVWLISADVTPRDRLAKIAVIKTRQPGIVVSTQTVEAGVDIDMDVVLRDFAPLDALIQVAGRCNRHNCLGEYGGRVEVVALRNANERDYAGMVYDPVLLDITREALADVPEMVGEDAVLELSRRYFDLIKTRKNTGVDLTETFARWGALPDIHTLLRGGAEQIAFLVLAEGEEWLRKRVEQALAVADRWERREALRGLAADVQQRTVSVYARRSFHPEDYAELLGPFWLLRPGYYDAESGLNLGLDEKEPATCIF